MDAETLARIQFGLTAAFHYIFPPMSIGLGVILVLLEGAYLKTKDQTWELATKFWVKIFAIVFAVGVATGIVMEFQFGTNWSVYSRFVGDIFGSALAAEGIFAFFLESGFLAVLVFGWNRVSPKVHFLSTIMVMLGSHFSAIWIIVANSWQQTPAAYKIVGEGVFRRAEITDFWGLVFNPSSMDRLVHAVVGAWATGAFFVLSVSAFYLLKKKHVEVANASLRVALPFALVASLLQPLTGHSSIAGVAKNQPAKLAAFEGHYDSNKPMDLVLFGWTNPDTQQTTALKIPGMASWLLYQDARKPVTGLDKFPKEDRPPVTWVFQTYHLMIGTGMLMILLAALAAFRFRTGKLPDCTLLLKALVVSVALPHIANQMGWMSAELGRQPWIVYGLLRTSQGLSKVVPASLVLTSLILFTLIYLMLFALFLFLLDRKIKEGPTLEMATKRSDRGAI